MAIDDTDSGHAPAAPERSDDSKRDSHAEHKANRRLFLGGGVAGLGLLSLLQACGNATNFSGKGSKTVARKTTPPMAGDAAPARNAPVEPVIVTPTAATTDAGAEPPVTLPGSSPTPAPANETGGDSDGDSSAGIDGTASGSNGTTTGSGGPGTGSDASGTGSDGRGTGSDDTGTGSDGTGTGSGSDGGSSSGSGSEPPPTNVEDPCNALNANRIDSSRMPVAPARFSPQVKAYGVDRSAMLVISLPNYTHADLKVSRIIVVRQDGRILALHSPTGADVKGDGTLRYVVLDNLNLKTERRFTLVFLTSDGVYSKWTMDADLTFETTFKGKNVVALATGEAHPTGFSDGQGIADFGEVFDSFGAAETIAFSSRRLMTAQSDSKHVKASLLADHVITDLMGVEVGLGATWTGILEHPTFFAYKLVGDRYVRTFIRIV